MKTISILNHVHKYVPTLTSSETITNLHTSAQVTAIADRFHYELFDGDMVTAKRARGRQGIRENSNRWRDHLKGLVPVVEDWHAKIDVPDASKYTISLQLFHTFTLICLSTCRSSGSSRDLARLYQMRKYLINWRNVINNPTKHVVVCEEFFSLWLRPTSFLQQCRYYVVSGQHLIKLFPKKAADLRLVQRRNVHPIAIQELLKQLVDLSFTMTPPNKVNTSVQYDHVQEYAREVLSMGPLLMEFADSIREGDGLRIIHCWRMFLPIFKATNQTNHSFSDYIILVFINNNCCHRQILQQSTQLHDKVQKSQHLYALESLTVGCSSDQKVWCSQITNVQTSRNVISVLRHFLYEIGASCTVQFFSPRTWWTEGLHYFKVSRSIFIKKIDLILVENGKQ